MKRGPSILPVAMKQARRHTGNSIKEAVNPISNEIKEYISKLVEKDMPEMAPEILMMDIQDIIATVLDFVEIYQTNNGIRVEVKREDIVGLIESITSMVNHNPKWIDETLEYFNELEIDPEKIEEIVISQILQVKTSGL